MAVVGIICEYDPFHLGHEKQLRLVRSAFGAQTPIVCLMSGNFVQRGMPAVFDKTVRARAAVLCGASLVLELPVTCALSSAEGFARGAVDIFDRVGVVDTLCFGSESGNAEALLRAAQTMCTPEYEQALREALQSGASYPAARQSALELLAGEGALLRAPNDILALEYCKALLEKESRIRPFAVHRAGGYHDAVPDPENPSATGVRALLKADGDWHAFVPAAAAAIYETAARHGMEHGERAMLARLRALEPEQWQRVPFGTEGLWSKAWKAAQTEPTLEGILTRAKSKRYPRTRLQRLVLCAYLGLTQEDLRAAAPYVRVLAFDENGRALVRRMRDEGSIPVVNAGAHAPDEAYYAMERRCAGLYGLFSEQAADATGCLEEKIRIFQRKK